VAIANALQLEATPCNLPL